MATDTSVKTDKAKASPLRLLILTPSTDTKTSPSPFPSFLETLTGASPSSDVTLFAGYTSHPPLHVKTKYYESNVSIWCDEVPSPESQSAQPTLSEWQEQMLSTSAREVRDVIGGLVILLPFTDPSSSPQTSTWTPYIEAATAFRDAVEDESGRDVASIIVLQDMSTQSVTITSSGPASKSTQALLEQVEEQCLNKHGIMGWDYVLWNSTSTPSTERPIDEDSRNEFGEKSGFPRIHEVLSSTDWTAGPSTTSADDDGSETESLYFLSHPGSNTNPTTTSDPHGDSNTSKTHEPSTTTSNHVENETATTHLLATSVDSTTSAIANTNIGDHELQRELLGLKMAMLEAQDGPSVASSLAGELDPADFGMRTPLPAVRTRLVRGESAASGVSGLRRQVDAGGDDVKEGGDDEDDADQEVQVEQLTGLMERVVAIREAAEGMSGSEREKFARREVGKIMKELG